MADANIKSFTSWKLAWADALMIGVEPRDFRVAFCLLQHANASTRDIYPSQARIAFLLRCSESTVERAVAKLVKNGWLERSRENRQQSNSYRFVESKLNAMTDEREFREYEWRKIRARLRTSEPSDLTPQNWGDPAEVTGREPSEVTGPDPAEVRGKHLKGTPEGEHLTEWATIEEGYNLDRSGTVPREEGDGEESPQGERDDDDFRVRRWSPSAALLNTEIVKAVRRTPAESLNAMFGESESPPK
jgi:predicted transcriptional regulator